MSNLQPDPWKVLGVDRSADKPEVRSAYRKLVLKCHPDKIQDPTLKAQKQDEFQKVQQAYELLNNDADRIKYEEQVKIAELRKQAALLSKNMPTTASRTPPRQHFPFEVRTAEPKFRDPSPHRMANVGAKVYATFHASTRPWDSDVNTRSQALHEDERRARRTTSYEQPARRDDDRREDRRRKEKEDDREKDRERDRRDRESREKEAAREARKAEKKRADKEREKERDQGRKRDSDDKRRHKSPYVEAYEEEEEVHSAPTPIKAEKLDKKKSSSSTKRADEPREKSSSRRSATVSEERDGFPRVMQRKTESSLEKAASYIERSRSKPATLGRSQTFHDPPTFHSPPIVPTPPPGSEYGADDDSSRRSPPRVANSARRASNESMPIRSKEKTSASAYPPSASHKKSSSREGVNVVEASSPRERAASGPVPPPLKKSHSTPPVVPESPPRPSRVNTLPQEPTYSRPVPAPPSLNRTRTWASGEDMESHRRSDPDSMRRAAAHNQYYQSSHRLDSDSDNDDGRYRRSTRRTEARSPEGTTRYKLDGHKTTRYDSHEQYYDDSSHSRKYSNSSGGYGSKNSYASSGFKTVKTARDYNLDDVTYSDIAMSRQSDPMYV